MQESSQDHRDPLHAYDPARGEPPTEACAEAVEASLADHALRAWWDAEQSFDRAFGRKLGDLPVPADLPGRILRAAAEEAKVTPFRPAVEQTGGNRWHWSSFAGAAAMVVFLALFFTFVRPNPAAAVPNQEVRTVMASLAGVLEGRTVETERRDGFAELVSHLQTQGAPVPKFIPAGLPQEGGFACAHFEVNGIPVGMLCFRVDDGVYHIFTIERRHFPQQREIPRQVVIQFGDHHCAAWTREDQLYILATREPQEKLEKRFEGTLAAR
jgi:hypothetical protein